MGTRQKPNWAYIWEFDCPISGTRQRTYTPLTAEEFTLEICQLIPDVNAVRIEGTKVDRNVVPAEPEDPPPLEQKRLPEFQQPTRAELRELWKLYPDNHVVRRTILELVRVQGRFHEAERLRASIQRVWNEDVGGQLVALHQLRLLLQEETRAADW
ncbi:hypothetical protein ACVCIH_05985 [Burkholderia glumae]|uniref:hypothetical protein n=1 Tax=Burkholderia glumae TaxID=337 RepID=UPI002036DB81|nr:hypothetical protein [Burkholderia glumae]MCM2492708.1 hypothetical protein [Burkholderia glumae]